MSTIPPLSLIVNEPARVYSVPPFSPRIVKKPSPVIAMSSAEPVCSIGPSEKFCVIASTEEPMPWIVRGLLSADPATISANSVRPRLNP